MNEGPKIDTGLFSDEVSSAENLVQQKIADLINQELSPPSKPAPLLTLPPPPPPIQVIQHEPIHDVFGTAESFQYNFNSIRECYESMMPIIKAFGPFTTKLFADMIRWRIRYSEGTVNFFIKLTDCTTTLSAISIEMDYHPHSAATILHQNSKDLAEMIRLQANLMAQRLRTGYQDPRLLIEAPQEAKDGPKRGPGRPPVRAKEPQPLPPAPPIEQVRFHIFYDLVFQPIVQTTVTGQMSFTGFYQMVGITKQGIERAKFEQELNYPPYRDTDLRTALYFYEGRGLKCYVQGPGQTVIMEGSNVVIEINGSKVNVPWGGVLSEPAQDPETEDE